MTPAVRSQCGCGYRHYWDGGEYDNLPERCGKPCHMTIIRHKVWNLSLSLSLSLSQNTAESDVGKSHSAAHSPLVPTGVGSRTELKCLRCSSESN